MSAKQTAGWAEALGGDGVLVESIHCCERARPDGVTVDPRHPDRYRGRDGTLIVLPPFSGAVLHDCGGGILCRAAKAGRPPAVVCCRPSHAPHGLSYTFPGWCTAEMRDRVIADCWCEAGLTLRHVHRVCRCGMTWMEAVRDDS